MRARLLVLTAGLVCALVLPAGTAPAAAPPASPPKWTTSVFSLVGSPGYPAYVMKHRNSRVYAGTYVNSDSTARSRVREWTRRGRLLRSWAVPGQIRDGSHGIQVANQTRDGKLILLETSRRAIMTLDTDTGRFRTIARLPAGAVPNYATWGPKKALYVTDYAQGVIWKVKRNRKVKRWFASPALQGVGGFGTTGIGFRSGPNKHDLLVSQQTSGSGPADPTRGYLYSLPVRPRGAPGRLKVLWTSQSTDLPDGFGIGRSGHIYLANVGLTNQLVELTSQGVEIDRFPRAPFSGENGSPVPFDNPSNMTFDGTSVLVANQSAIAGDPSHQAILRVEIGERGRATYLPRKAYFFQR